MLAAVLALAVLAPAQGRGRGGRGGGNGLAPGQVVLDAPNSYNAAAAARGKVLFTAQCASCHGEDARGGAGKARVDLIESAMVLDDLGGQEIGEFLKYGRPEKKMPAFPALTPAQVSDIATFLHRSVADAAYRFDYKTINDFTGNAQAGEAFFNGPVGKCSTCHSATGDMQGLAAKNRDDAPTIQSLIVNGGPRFATGGAATTATVTLKNGQKFTGTPVLADDFMVTIKLPDGETHSWLRNGAWPEYAEHDPLQAHKELALQYTDADIHNLAAYLETLTGAGPSAAAPRAPLMLAPARGPSRPAPALRVESSNPDPSTGPLGASWTTYHGDYSGRHYSTLDQINRTNVKSLTTLWVKQIAQENYGPNTGTAYKAGNPLIALRGSTAGVRIAAEPLMVNGVLYLSSSDHAWAIDARTGRELWHYYWTTSGGTHSVGNRGMGMYGDWLYFETPDCYLVSLDAKTGKERWHKEIADVRQYYFCSPAPTVIKDHVIVGEGGDSLDLQGSLKSFDPSTGALQWTWDTTPQKPDDPGYNSWPDEYARTHGGGMTWQPPTYDPQLNLLYVPTGNPNPVGATQSRAGDDLYTCSVVALNPDTGKMVWYYQTSPHDSHDWDSTQVPVLFDGTWDGKPRKLLAQATRNGYFFVLDRVTGQHLLTKALVDPQYITWSKGINAKGQPISDPKKEPAEDGVLVGPGSATNWPPPSYSPESGLFYVGTAEGLEMDYRIDVASRPEGFGYVSKAGVTGRNGIRAIDYKTGTMQWFHAGGGPQGLLTTAGHLLFGGDGHGNFMALDQDTGKTLWHTALRNEPSDGPETFMLDGQQVVLVAAGDMLYAFTLNE